MDLLSKISSIGNALEALYFERKANSSSLTGAWKDDLKTKDLISKFKNISGILHNSAVKLTMVLTMIVILYFVLTLLFQGTSFVNAICRSQRNVAVKIQFAAS